MATEIANAYLALYTTMPGVKDDIAKALGGAGDTVEKSGASMGSRLMEGMNGIGKVGAVAVGGAIAAGIGTALVKGFQRLDSLDQAESKLTGLGHSAATVDQIMENALASVRGTAFGMGEAATTAAGAVAAGIKPGKDLERTLKAVADASTIAGTDMGSMGAIFNKVAASNKVQMDVINQLHDAGVPALALLADQMGVTAEEASKMASAGQIDFATFQSAMESGMGGAALESGKTFSGAMDNVMASLGRMGAGLLEGIFPEMKDGLGGLLEAMQPLEEIAKDVGKAFGEFIGFIADNIDWIGPLATGIGIVVAALVALNVVMWILSINPITLLIMAIVLGLGLLIGAIILLVQNWDTVIAWISDVWSGFMAWIGDVWDGFMTWFVSVIEGFVGWWNGIWSAIGQFVADVWNGIIQWISGAILNILNFVSGVLGSIRAVWENVWNGIGSFLRGVWNNILGWIEGGVNGAIDLINGMLGGLSGVAGVIGIEVGSVPNIRIPRLAEGGLVSARRGGILANIGEGRYDEAVVPLGGPQLDRLAAKLGSGPDNGGDTYNLYTNDPILAAREAAELKRRRSYAGSH